MKKQVFAFCGAAALSCAVIGGLVALSAKTSFVSPTFSGVNPYELVIDSYSAATNGATTAKGNTIEFATSELSSYSGVGSLASGGYIYNTTKISGIGHVVVTLASGAVDIYYGKNSNLSWDDFVSGPTADFESIRPNYFKIVATENAVISSIRVQYDCTDYQAAAESIPYQVYVNDELVKDTFFEIDKDGNDKQYQIKLDVYAGDMIRFEKNGNSINVTASGDGNNAYSASVGETETSYLIVNSTKPNADLYLKINGGNHDIWLTGNGNYISDSSLQGGTILQAFNWTVGTITANLDNIKNAGYNAIQVSPLQVRKDVNIGGAWLNEWWKLYQPQSLSLTDYPDCSYMGKRDDLRTLCASAKAKGIDVILDVVLNHLAGSNYETFDDQVQYFDDGIIANKDLKHTYGSAGSSQESIVKGAIGDFPDLMTEDIRVQNLALSFLEDAMDCGISGFRFDAAKHIETPSDGSYGSSFWPHVVNGIKRYAVKKGYDTPYLYGEILGAGNDRNINWYAPFMSVTENSNAYNLRDGVVGWDGATDDQRLAKITGDYYAGMTAGAKKYVLWAESHDQYKSGETSGIEEININKVYAIQASRVNASTLYLARPSNSFGSVGSTAWKGSIPAAVNKLNSRFAGGSEYIEVNYNGNKSFVNVRSANGEYGAVIVNILNGNNSYSVHLPGMPNGTYVDLVTGKDVTVSSEYATVSPSNGVAVLSPKTGVPQYYLIGNETFTGTNQSWTVASGICATHTGDNVAEISEHRFEKGAEVKVVKVQDGEITQWYNADLASSYDYCSVTANDSNLRFDKGGTYSITVNNTGTYYVSGTPDGGSGGGGQSSSEASSSAQSSSQSSQAQSVVTIYFQDAGWWRVDNARTGIYLWKGGTNNGWPGVAMTKLNNGYWSYQVDTTQYDSMIFVRINNAGAVADWGAKTVTVSLSSYTAAKPLYTIDSTSELWGDPGVTGSWAAYNA